MRKGFTLTEILIVIAILGILAAIVVPQFADASQESKELAATANLTLLRNAINTYAIEHNGIQPGYVNNDTSTEPDGMIFLKQLAMMTNSLGQNINPEFGPYLSNIPENPLNGLKLTRVISNSQPFPSEPTEGTFGWIYKPETKEIRLNSPGTDSQGVSYFDY